MELMVRLVGFLLILGLMAGWEWLKPLRALSQTRSRRWLINLGLTAFNVAILRITVGAAAWLAALWAAENHIGAFNQLQLPTWLAVTISLLLLDLAIYGQHIAAHRWRWFWRLHQVHHSDLDFDATTALRFHPLEILLSMFYKAFCVVLIGAPALAVVAFEVILNGCALFNHGNVSLPAGIERRLRLVLVTPDMHRIHHSARPSETDSNYGFSLSCWDRLFRTYCAQPQESQASMTIGLHGFRRPEELDFIGLLAMPFKALRQR
jgi:sterol desaturase/sphingolipid hydroxylase (fatty acid hydroxylase superfamily)